MDEPSRMARAKELGFRTDDPVYHGSAADFEAFDRAKGGATTGAAPAREGVWATRDPQDADFYADLAAGTQSTRLQDRAEPEHR
jgi:hypothetical protein